MSIKTMSRAQCGELRYPVDEAVLLLQQWFSRKAARMSKDNISLIADIVQEMSMGVLLCKGENTLSFYKQQAVFRARDLLRREKRQKGRVERYSRLSHRVSEGDDTPFIEGLIDLEDRISSRNDGGDVVEFDSEARVSA